MLLGEPTPKSAVCNGGVYAMDYWETPDIVNAVWDYESAPFTRTVDMHIAKLRKKIEDSPADPRFIVTVHRVGYKFTG